MSDFTYERGVKDTMAKLKESHRVHTLVLRGDIALTKTQAIHIAGLPANIESLAKDKFREGLVAARDAVTSYAQKLDEQDAPGEVEGAALYAAGEIDKLIAKTIFANNS